MTTEARALARSIVAEVFDAGPHATSTAPVAPTEAQLVARRILAEIVADGVPAPSTEAVTPAGSEEPAASEEHAASGEPTGSDLAARMVAEVLGDEPARQPPPPNPADRVGPPAPDAPPSVDPTATRRLEEDPPPRTGRWILVTLAAAIALAVLFPLAVRALLQLLTMS